MHLGKQVVKAGLPPATRVLLDARLNNGGIGIYGNIDVLSGSVARTVYRPGAGEILLSPLAVSRIIFSQPLSLITDCAVLAQRAGTARGADGDDAGTCEGVPSEAIRKHI